VLTLAAMRASSTSGLSFDFDVVFAEAESPPRRTSRSRHARHGRWPLALCTLVAVVAACAAFTESPLGQRPEVRAQTDAVHVAVATAWHGIARRADRIVRR